MPGKMARSAPRPPFGLPGDGSRPRRRPVLPERGKSAKINASSGYLGNPSSNPQISCDKN